MFDCGEGTVRQLLRSNVRLSDLKAVFITHLHGDHFYGIPGLGMRMIGMEAIPIYAPEGLLSVFPSNNSLRGFSYKPIVTHQRPAGSGGGLRRGGPADGAVSYDAARGAFRLFEDEHIVVRAAPIKHSVHCLGFVIEEKPKRGHIDVERLRAMGVEPGPIYKTFKRDTTVTLPDGRLLSCNDIMAPTRGSRKVVILGDTCDPSGIAELAMDADVLVHEATCTDEERNIALMYHHSTAGMAGEFARAIRAKHLILTHFSPRNFRNNDLEEALAVRKLVEQASRTFGRDAVFPARVRIHAHALICSSTIPLTLDWPLAIVVGLLDLSRAAAGRGAPERGPEPARMTARWGA